MPKFNKHIIIVGTARSGTSWLSETIAQQHRYRMLFEPEQETRTKKGYLLCDKWFETYEESPEAHAYLNQVFANRVDCDWIGQNSNRKFKRHLWPFIPKKYVIKFVRANLLAKYINASFQIPVIHIIRDPYEVIASQLRVNFPWLTDLSIFASQPKLVQLIENRFRLDISHHSHYSKLELLTLRWCIENVIPLEVLEPYTNNSAIIKYEDLVGDIQVFYKMCQQFNIDYIDTIEEIYQRPSSKAHSNGSISIQKQIIDVFTSDELQQMNTILDIFETKLYPRILK